MFFATKNHSSVKSKGYDYADICKINLVARYMIDCDGEEGFYHQNSGMNDCWLP